jgi:hypothetical protein
MLSIKQYCHQDNVDCPPSLDKEGLELAFKYFSSTTLTMRLCGINQGTKGKAMKSEMERICASAPIVEAPFSLTVFKTGSKDGEHIRKKEQKNVQMLNISYFYGVLESFFHICELGYSSVKWLLSSFGSYCNFVNNY